MLWFKAENGATRDYQRQLEFSESYLSSLSADTSSALDILGTLSESFKAVGAQTAAFQSQCENLISEQQRLNTLADDLGQNLKYYSFLEPITRRLNAPGAGSFVRGKEFSDMLARLDECLEYMAAHVSVATLCLEKLLTIANASPNTEKLQPINPDTAYF